MNNTCEPAVKSVCNIANTFWVPFQQNSRKATTPSTNKHTNTHVEASSEQRSSNNEKNKNVHTFSVLNKMKSKNLNNLRVICVVRTSQIIDSVQKMTRASVLSYTLALTLSFSRPGFICIFINIEITTYEAEWIVKMNSRLKLEWEDQEKWKEQKKKWSTKERNWWRETSISISLFMVR